MILLIDNYDSFSYNLYQIVGQLEANVCTIRNDQYTVGEIKKMNPTHIILSPGPGRPDKAGVCEQVIEELAGKIPILGVCLGHQAICEVFGAEISYAKQLMHGKASKVKLDLTSKIFSGLNGESVVARYHSLAAIAETIPKELKVTAVTEDGEIMAVEHKQFPVYGLQFHPESILTPDGVEMLKNFLKVRL